MANTVSKRKFLKSGLASGAALLCGSATILKADKGGSGSGGSGSGSGSSGTWSTLTSSSGLTSPPVRSWFEPLFQPEVAQPLTLNPGFQMDEPARDWWSPYEHQRCDEPKLAPRKFYQLDIGEVQWQFHQDLPLVKVWGYGAVGGSKGVTSPGAMIHAKYGEPFVLRWNNTLNKAYSGGIGTPESATHLHNMHTASESDGFPGDYVTSGNYRDSHYTMCRAGYDQYPATNGDYRESLGTLWYHDHRFNYTSQNVYKGLYGFCNAFDEYDTGNETDPSPALGLPSGDCDVMLGFLDPQFDNSGNIFFNTFDTDGHLGDKIAVNGKIQPSFEVKARKYRFRLLDAGPSRFYQFFLSKGVPGSQGQAWLPMTLIGNDGNLLESPIQVTDVLLGVANRMDVVIDFTAYEGQELYLVNRLEQTSGRGPTYNLMNPGYPVLKFKVLNGKVADPSKVPATLRPMPRPTSVELSNAVQRTFRFDRSNGAWTVNGKLANIDTPTASPKRGSTEIWTIQNNSGSWSHPIHIHFEEFQILDRNGVKPKNFEDCRKDVLILHPNESVRVFFRFRDFVGRYVMHCHNVVHEDHAMMIRWDIVP